MYYYVLCMYYYVCTIIQILKEQSNTYSYIYSSFYYNNTKIIERFISFSVKLISFLNFVALF